MSSEEQSGGAMKERHFRVCELNGKKVHLGSVTLKPSKGKGIMPSPQTAAMKLLSSIAKEKGLKGMNKLKLGKVTFSIQESTQGSKKKVYGPYDGRFREYTAEEKKKSVIKNKKTGKLIQAFKMKGIVKLSKKKNNNK